MSRMGYSRVDPERMPGFCGYVLRNTQKVRVNGRLMESPEEYYLAWTDEEFTEDARVRAFWMFGLIDGQVAVWEKLEEAREVMQAIGGELRAVRISPHSGRLCRIWGWAESLEA